MSVTTNPAAQPSSMTPEPWWAKPSIGIYSLCLFVVAFGVALYLKNETATNLLIGAVITNGTTVINFYFGSSSGSAAKTAMLTPPAPAPGATT